MAPWSRIQAATSLEGGSGPSSVSSCRTAPTHPLGSPSAAGNLTETDPFLDRKLPLEDPEAPELFEKISVILHEIFFKLRDQTGCTMVIVTHNDKFAEMADRKVILKDGKIIS